MPRPVVVVPHDRRWAERAAQLIAALREHTGEVAERIEHIGSTAIPGMAAKDVLDVQLSVADLDRAAQALEEPLALLGFQAQPYVHDHVPAGSADDPGRWAKRVWARRDHPDGDANLHARVRGSPGERLALLFRAWFRVRAEAVAAYSAFKVALAAEVVDVERYSDLKDPVVDLVIVAAEQWAAASGWRPEPPDTTG